MSQTYAKIIDGSTEYVLPDGMLWTDEYDWDRVQQSYQYTLTGTLYVQRGDKQAGRPLTLAASQDSGWMSREQLEQLAGLLERPVLTVDYHGRTFTAIWNHEQKAISATPVVSGNVPSPTEQMVVTLRFTIIP